MTASGKTTTAGRALTEATHPTTTVKAVPARRGYRPRHAAGRYVDAAPVRDHVRAQQQAGLPFKRQAELAGISPGTVTHLLYGRTGYPPAKRVQRETAEALLGVRATLDNIPDSASTHAAGTSRRLRALGAQGWCLSMLAAELGTSTSNLKRIRSQERVNAQTAKDVRALYERLWNQPPPQQTTTQRRLSARARNRARAQGWPPPAGLDDDLIDLPEPDLQAELERRVALMDHDELAACSTAYRKHGDRSPLVAAALEYRRRETAARTTTREDPQ